MSKIEVNAVEPQCGTTLTLGGHGVTGIGGYSQGWLHDNAFWRSWYYRQADAERGQPSHGTYWRQARRNGRRGYNYIIDENRIHLQVQANKQKPKKESKFQRRMREMMEQAEQQKKLK